MTRYKVYDGSDNVAGYAFTSSLEKLVSFRSDYNHPGIEKTLYWGPISKGFVLLTTDSKVPTEQDYFTMILVADAWDIYTRLASVGEVLTMGRRVFGVDYIRERFPEIR